MNQAQLDQLVHAVLYEGYILYPYRATSKKNQVGRFTFGRVYPENYSRAEEGRERCLMQTEFLVRDESKDAVANVSVRFLQPLARQIGKLPKPIKWSEESQPEFTIVPSLQVGDELHQTWQEAIEREIQLPDLNLRTPGRVEKRCHFAGTRKVEPILSPDGLAVGIIVRQTCALEGMVEVEGTTVHPDAVRLRVRILNQTPVANDLLNNQDEIIQRTFASTHTILRVAGGECISLLDPPGQYLQAAKECSQIGSWPVLVGDKNKGERDLMLSSPIILYDYPRIAPESPGDLFDGSEIDEILTLRIQTLTDAEKLEMRQVDQHARRLLERTENLSERELLKLHGVMRPLHTNSLDEEFFNPKKPLQEITIAGVALKAGDRVRIKPKRRADVMDIALDGRIAVIESVLQDVDDQVQLALVLEDDPGRDLGLTRQPGHRFFYGADEIVPVKET
jgi:hydrogenase maturation protease